MGILLWASLAGCNGDSDSSAGTDFPAAAALPVSRVSGVNLFHLEPGKVFDSYLAHEDFVANLVAMEWNTFRLPIEWDDFVDESGTLDPRKIQQAGAALKALVERLHEVHLRTHQPLFLIIDFHQYKFGRACGGVGIPRGAIPEHGLNASDTNCLFRAFDRFWRNENRVQDRWNEWAMAILGTASDLFQRNADWLSIGIEPMNEPQFGMPNGMFSSNPITAMLSLKRWVESGGPQSQINDRLIPFYQRFLNALGSQPFGPALLQNAYFIAEPFVFDHIKLSIGTPPLRMEVVIDGRYDAILNLSPLVRWVAAPHHYLGAMDPGVLDVLPASLRDVLGRYPNSFFTREVIRERIEWMSRRMAEAGMQSFFGEWGTQTTLLNQDGTSGGHEPWIRDSLDAIDRHSAGHLWWQYQVDTLPAQTGFGLLRQNAEGRQILKCSVARLVFGRCR